MPESDVRLLLFRIEQVEARLDQIARTARNVASGIGVGVAVAVALPLIQLIASVT